MSLTRELDRVAPAYDQAVMSSSGQPGAGTQQDVSASGREHQDRVTADHLQRQRREDTDLTDQPATAVDRRYHHPQELGSSESEPQARAAPEMVREDVQVYCSRLFTSSLLRLQCWGVSTIHVS